jgi:hypothetical protein
MNADQVGQTPILGREGLLRPVEVIERLRARARGEEGGSWTTGEDPGPTVGGQTVLGGTAGSQPPSGGAVAGGVSYFAVKKSLPVDGAWDGGSAGPAS